MAKPIWSALLAGSIAVCLLPQQASAWSDDEVRARVVCGAWSGDPVRGAAFQDTIKLRISEEMRISGERDERGVEDKYRGIIAPSGAVLIAGKGKHDDRGAAWIWEFSGKMRPGGTVLRGKMVSTRGGVGSRDCTMTF